MAEDCGSRLPKSYVEKGMKFIASLWYLIRPLSNSVKKPNTEFPGTCVYNLTASSGKVKPGSIRVTDESDQRTISYNPVRIVFNSIGRWSITRQPMRHCPTLLLIRHVTLERADQVWDSDFTYIRLRGEWVYLAVILDLFTRAIRGWHLGREMTERLVTAALQNALATHAAPAIHHSDQGVQYCATGYVAHLQQADVQVSMSAAGRPTENAFVERVIRTLKEEEVALNDYADFEDAQQRIGQFLDVYNTKRIHSALGYKTPAEYEALMRVQSEKGGQTLPTDAT